MDKNINDLIQQMTQFRESTTQTRSETNRLSDIEKKLNDRLGNSAKAYRVLKKAVKDHEASLKHLTQTEQESLRVIKTKFLEDILRGERKEFNCVYQCLRTCDPATVQYCIAKALINAADGDIDNAVVLAGTNVPRVKKIVPVKELIDEIVTETVEELNKELRIHR